MPSKKQYNLVNDDAYDSRIPLHSEEAFQHGITFHAKYIGTLDIPRPGSRVEIVAAMRRIRYEFKTKGINKKKIVLTVSIDGVKVALRGKKKKNLWPWEENKLLLMHHPVYRIFYVSHDSQDLKIFSYIARDGGSNVFKCNVFKSNKKSQAMKIVRTVGQAFEVCHKLSLTHIATESKEDIPTEKRNNNNIEMNHKGRIQEDCKSESNNCDRQSSNTLNLKAQDSVESQSNKIMPLAPPACEKSIENSSEVGEIYSSPLSEPLPLTGAVLPEGTPLSVYHQLQILKHQLEQQSQQTQVAVAQVQLLKDQVTAESTARLEAQAHNHQLMVHNKELLDHIQSLVKQVKHLEQRMSQLEGRGNTGLPELPPVPEVSTLTCSVATPSPGPVILPSFLQKNSQQVNSACVQSDELLSGPQQSFPEKWLQRYSPNSSTTSSLSSTHHTQEKAADIQPSLPYKNSPSKVNFSSSSDKLLKQSPSQIDGSLRMKTISRDTTDMLSNHCATDVSSNVPSTSTPPRLHPPPQRSRGIKNSQLTNCLSDMQNNGSFSSSLSGKEAANTLPSYSDLTSQRNILSWPSVTTNQVSSSKIAYEDYSNPLRQNNHSHPSVKEHFVSQTSRDMCKMNFNEHDYVRPPQPHHFNR